MRLGVNGRFAGAHETGVQRFATEIVRRMADRADVALLLPRGAPLPDALRGRVDAVRGVLRGRAWEQLELPFTARRARADVVLHPANSAPLWGGPHVVVLHDLAPLQSGRHFRLSYRIWVRVAHAGSARRAAAIATVSHWSAGQIADDLGVPRETITIVRQGAGPLDAPASATAVDQVRARHGIAGPYAVAMTGGDPRKGLAFLDEVWRLWPSGAGPELIVVGERVGHVHRRSPSGAAPGIRRLGHVLDEELRALLTGAVALLHPSGYEGFGRPPLEALACGTAVVAAPYGPAREVLGECAEVLPTEAPAWKAVVDGLVAEGSVARARRIELGRARAAQHRWEDGADELVALCLRAAESK